MANDVIGFSLYSTGETYYAVINDRDRKVADIAGGAEPFVTFVNANIDNYDLVLTETPAASSRYQATFPSWISAGRYSLDVFLQSGASPAVGDSLLFGTIIIDWDGSSIVQHSDFALASVCTEARLAELDAVNLPADVAAIKVDTAAILLDTNELQMDWTDGGRLDLIIDAIAAGGGGGGATNLVTETTLVSVN